MEPATWPKTLNEQIDKAKKQVLKSSPPRQRHVHYVSDVGHPCERYLYYCIVEWDKRDSFSERSKGNLEMGGMMEEIFCRWFNKDVGPKMDPPLVLIEPAEKAQDRLLADHRISGVYDWLLCYRGTPNKPICILDGKSCSPNLFPLYTDASSLKRFTWSYKYIAQIQLYNFAANYADGGILFYSKGNMFYDWKIIHVPVDFGYVESILQKCTRVNRAIDNNAVPDRLNQPFWCNGCPFESFCIPELEVSGEGPVLNDNEEIDLLVKKVIELKPLAKQYEAAFKELKGKLVKKQDLITKHAIIQWVTQQVNMPAKAAYSFEKCFPKLITETD